LPRTSLARRFARTPQSGSDVIRPEVSIVEGGTVVGPHGKSLPLAGLSSEPISAEGAFLNKKHTYTYGAHAAHVAVDPSSGTWSFSTTS